MKQCLLREELEYATYVGEHYKAEEYGINHWKHDPGVADLLQKKLSERNAVSGVGLSRMMIQLSSA